MRPHIDHVELTVSDLSRAERFYDALLPLLGFDLRHKGRGDFPDFDHTEIDYATADFSLGLVSPRRGGGRGRRRRKPGALHHLAFAADSRERWTVSLHRSAPFPACGSGPHPGVTQNIPRITTLSFFMTPRESKWKSSTSPGNVTFCETSYFALWKGGRFLWSCSPSPAAWGPFFSVEKPAISSGCICR